MSLATGTRLGPYEITARLGAGGMGEVYRARDVRLDRTVAVKVLPEDLARDDVRLERFEREAKAVSTLNHPYICTLHDVGEQDGIHYLVMEYVEGEGLDDRLRRGRLPMQEALRASRQIADALDKAHHHGIIHRDLKPGNIILTESGIKLLDFGLAKLAAGDEGVAPLSDLTQGGSSELTAHGSIVGTLEHMAPEQLEGKTTGVPADIFALGTLIYEMVTGVGPFRRDSTANVIAAILDHEPPSMSTVEPATPEELDHIVWRCLRKTPEERWQDAGDVMRELEWVEELGTRKDSGPSAQGTGKRPRSIGALALGVVAVIVIAAAVFLMTRAPQGVEMRLEISTPATVDAGMLAVSPDGRAVVFVANTETGSRLLLRPLSSISAEALSGTEGAEFPFWSSDSQAIGFFADGQLKRINLESRLVQILGPASLGRGGTWSGDTILYVPNPNGPVFRVPAAGGRAEALELNDEAGNHAWPVFLPDGQHFLYFAAGSGVWVGDMEDSTPIHLLDDSYSSAVFSPTGHLLFVRQGALLAQEFDAGALGLRGDPFPVAEQVPAPAGHAAVSVAGNGTIVYRSGEATRRLVRLDRQGREIGQPAVASAMQTLALSPDGMRVSTGGADIWTFELATSREERVTSEAAGEWMSVWSPDGNQLAFASNRLGRYGVYTIASSGTGPTQLIVERGLPTDWSADGKFLLYRASEPATGDDIWAVPMDPPGMPFPVVETDATERDAVFSPDGAWIAYESNRTGQFEIYVQSFPDPTRVRPVSVGGGAQPRWSADGTELFYIALNRDLMSVPIGLPTSGSGDISIGEPQFLFRTRIIAVVQQFRQQYAVFPDGQEFLMSVLPDDRDTPPIDVILNWAG